MSDFTKKNRYSIKQSNGNRFSIHKDSPLAKRIQHEMKLQKKAHMKQVREYKQRLKEEKKKYPLEQRSKLTWKDLAD